MCVSCDLLLHSCPSSLHPSSSSAPSALYRAIENFPCVLSRFLFYMIEDTFLLFRVLFYVIEDVLLPYSTFYLNIEDGDCMCMCICVCIRVVGYFPPVSCASFLSPIEKGLHRVSRYTSGTNPPPRKLDFSLVTTPYFFFCYYNPAPRRSRSSLDSSVVSLRCFSPLARRSSGFNFVHFCFLNYLLVSSIRRRQFYVRGILFFGLLFCKSAKPRLS